MIDYEDFIDMVHTNPKQETYGAVFLLSTMEYVNLQKTTIMQLAVSFLERWYAASVLGLDHKFTRGFSLQHNSLEGTVSWSPNVVDSKADRANDPCCPLCCVCCLLR